MEKLKMSTVVSSGAVSVSNEYSSEMNGTSEVGTSSPQEPPTFSDKDYQELAKALKEVDEEAKYWETTLTVNIGRASEWSKLKDTQIRYFEQLQVFQPTTTTGQAGAMR